MSEANRSEQIRFSVVTRSQLVYVFMVSVSWFWWSVSWLMVSFFKVSVDIGQFCNDALATRLVAPETAVAVAIKIIVAAQITNKIFPLLLSSAQQMSRLVGKPSGERGRRNFRETELTGGPHEL